MKNAHFFRIKKALEKPPFRANRKLMPCMNKFCRLQEQNTCHADEYVSMVCKPYVFWAECSNRKKFEKLARVMNGMST
jgi:hypothetical protein